MYCINKAFNMSLQQCHLDALLYIVHLASKGILISTATVSPCQDLLSNIVGYSAPNGGHSLLLLLLCYSVSISLAIKLLLNQMCAWIELLNTSLSTFCLILCTFCLQTGPLGIHLFLHLPMFTESKVRVCVSVYQTSA